MAIAAAPCAHASLGGDAASIDGENLALQGALSIQRTPRYEIREITNGSAMDIREYLNARGMVFAVSWQGPVPPDLQQLLGKYFEPYTAALAALDHPGLHRSVRVATATLIVESSGHLRTYSGRAYLPGEVPAGVPMTDLR